MLVLIDHQILCKEKKQQQGPTKSMPQAKA
jgi:hypothetical protein